jgi:hypothetical protein
MLRVLLVHTVHLMGADAFLRGTEKVWDDILKQAKA